MTFERHTTIFHPSTLNPRNMEKTFYKVLVYTKSLRWEGRKGCINQEATEGVMFTGSRVEVVWRQGSWRHPAGWQDGNSKCSLSISCHSYGCFDFHRGRHMILMHMGGLAIGIGSPFGTWKVLEGLCHNHSMADEGGHIHLQVSTEAG